MKNDNNEVHISAAFNRVKRVGILVAIALVLLLLPQLIRLKVIATENNYPFFPRADLNGIYTNFKELAENTTGELGYDENIINEAEEYYKNMSKCLIKGNYHQEGNSEFVIRFDRYDPDFENEHLSILADYGKIVFDSDLRNRLTPLSFDICAFQYKDADLFSKRLSIQSVTSSDEFILGYIRTVYISPTGSVKTYCIPLSQTNTVIESKEGMYFLKEFCIFSAYSTDSILPDADTIYRVQKNDAEICEYILQRNP